MTDRSAADVLIDFSRHLATHTSVQSVFETLGDYCTELLDVDGIGVLLIDEGSLSVATTNSPRGDAVERLEVELEEGPCTDCIRSGERVHVPDLSADRQYPSFTPRAMDAGARGIHALPLGLNSDHLIGALDIVTVEPRTLTDGEIRMADMLADVAVSYLVAIRAQEESNELASQLRHALDSRTVIEQAKGVLVGRHGIGLDEAFERMRAHSRNNNLRIHDVARRIAAGELDVG